MNVTCLVGEPSQVPLAGGKPAPALEDKKAVRNATYSPEKKVPEPLDS
jgi:hypothetical protein